jgi:hypothetical protein
VRYLVVALALGLAVGPTEPVAAQEVNGNSHLDLFGATIIDSTLTTAGSGVINAAILSSIPTRLDIDARGPGQQRVNPAQRQRDWRVSRRFRAGRQHGRATLSRNARATSSGSAGWGPPIMKSSNRREVSRGY